MVRKYRNSDLENILTIWEKASNLAHFFLGTDFLEKEKLAVRDIYLPQAETWVFEENKQVVGFISMMENEIGGLFVHPQHQAKGIGTHLVNFVADLHEELEVEVFRKNIIGRAFYEKYGFKTFKETVHQASGQLVLRMAFDKL